MKKLKLLSYFYSLLILMALSALPSMAIEVTVGNSNSIDSTNNYPFQRAWGGVVTQILVHASEISSGATTINSVSFDLRINANATDMQNFSVKMQNTTMMQTTATLVSSGFTTVFSGPTWNTGTGTGWKTITFNEPFTWDGSSNILMEICWTNNAYNGGTGERFVRADSSYFNSVTYKRADNRANCDSVFSSTNAVYASNFRPVVKFDLAASTAPYISALPDLLDLGYTMVEGYSAAKSISIAGGNLTPASSTFTLTPSEGFQVSVDNGTTWTSEPTSINYSGASIATPIPVKVRFNPQLEQAYTGTLTIAGGSATRVVNLSGTSLLTYCTPTITGTTGLDIARINIGSFDNSSQATTPLLSNTESNQTFNDFRATAPILNLQAGTTVPYSFNVISSATTASTAYLKVYVDLNRDAIINPVTERVDSLYFTAANMNTNAGLFTSNLNIPPNAVVGQNTLIRFLLTTTAATQPCGSYASGETEDYWVNLSVAPPYVLATPSSLQFGYVAAEENSAVQTISLTGGNLNSATGSFYLTTSEGYQISTDSGTTWTNEASLDYVANPIVTPIPVMVRFTPFEVMNYAGTLTIEGGGATRVVNLSGTSILTYCTSTATNVGDEDIGNVTISQNGNILLNNGTALPSLSNPNSVNLYSDNTASIPAINLQGANQYQISVSQINKGSFYGSAIKVYIDYNVNGTFDLPQELAFSANTVAPSNANTPNTYSGVINVPPTVNTSGAATARMRVVIDESDVAPACGTYSYGETEDYLVHFLPAPSFVMASVVKNDFGVVIPGTQSASKDITIQAGALIPTSGNLTVTSSANYQISLDSITWSDAPLTLAYTDGGATVTPSKVKVRFNSPTALGLGFAGTVTINGANAQAPAVINLIANNMQTYPASSVKSNSETDNLDIAKITIGSYSFGEANVTPITARTEATKKYSDNRLAAQELILNAGAAYQYTVNTYTTGASMPLCSLRVYADYNADGDFTDNSELISNVAIPVANNGIVSGTFMVPTDTNIVKINRLNSPRIRFVLSTISYNSSTDTTYQVGETEDYRLKIAPALQMNYVSTTTEQVGKRAIKAGSTNENILKVKVSTNNSANPLNLTNIVFNTNGTNPNSALSAARVYFTRDTATFNTNTPIAAANEEPNGVLNFEAEGNIVFKPGDNYLWLAYSVAADAGLDAVLDAELTGLYLSDAPTVNKITTPQAPEGISLVTRTKFDGKFPYANGETFPYNDGWKNLNLVGYEEYYDEYSWTEYVPWRTVAAGSSPVNAPHNGDAMAEYFAYNYQAGSSAALISPAFAMNGTNEPTSFSLWLYRHQNATSANATGSIFKVYINTTPNLTNATLIKPIGYPNADSINVRYDQGLIPEPAIGWYNYSYEIPSTFTDTTNYLIFVGVADGYNSIHLDDVLFGSDSYMSVTEIDTLNTGNDVFARETENNLVNAFNVQAFGTNQAFDISNIKFTPEGTTNLASISNAKVWYLGGTAVFNPATNKLFGTVATIASGQNTVVRTADSAVIKLAEGNNYFAITYDVPANATAGTVVDCKVNSITLSRDGEEINHIIANGNTWGTHEIKLPLSGTYTVGGTPLASRWYPNLVDITDEINILGASGNIEIKIAGDLTIDPNNAPGLLPIEGNYSVNIYPTTNVNITSAYTGTLGMFTIGATDNITIDGRINRAGTARGLTFTNTANGRNLMLTTTRANEFVNNATIKYCNFVGNDKTSSSSIAIQLLNGRHTDVNISNCDFKKVYYGINMVDGTDTTKAQNLTIENNHFGDALVDANSIGYIAANLAYADNVQFNNNTISNIINSSSFNAVNLANNITNSVFRENKFNKLINNGTNRVGAFYVNSVADANVNFYSNSISGINSNATGVVSSFTPAAFFFNSGSNYKVINNSVRLNGNRSSVGTTAPSTPSSVVYVASAVAGLDIRNNIFVNELISAVDTLKNYVIYSDAPASAFTAINNNNYYVSGTSPVIGYIGAAGKLTLADWQASTTQDAGSVNTKVAFLSDSDMHLSGASACNTALNCPLASEVSSDIDGADRGNVTKMGVDEVNATFSITGQPVSTVSQCVTLGSNNTIEIPVGTFSVSPYSDGIARPFNAGDLEYSWTKNNEAIAGNSAPLKVLFSGTTLPTTNDVYKATVTFLNTSFTPTTLTLVEGPTVFTLTRTGTSPMTIGLNSSESGATYTLLRNSVEVANSSMVGTGQALAFGSFSEAGTYRIKSVKGSCETIMKDSAVIIQAGYTLSGTIKYANTAQTAMNNCIIIIKSGDLEVRRDTTDATGVYSVSGLANGTYSIEVLTTKVHGGINTFDITPIKQKLANIIELSPLKFKAADLNKSNSINTFDITPIKQKLANQVAPGWVASNYVFYPVSVTIASGNSTLDIQSLCSGDVNGSFVPSSGN